MLAIQGALARRLRQARVRVVIPDEQTILFRGVPADARVFNKPRTNLLVKKPEEGMPLVICVDEDLRYTGEDPRLAQAFAAAGCRQGWRILLLPRGDARDLSHAVEEALGVLGFAAPPPAADETAAGRPSGKHTNLLEAFGADLTRQVREGAAEVTIGRREHLERVAAAVLSRQPRLALIAGEGGVGKTNLLYAVARKLAERRPPLRVLSVNLALVMAGTRLDSEREILLHTLLEQTAAADAVLALEHLELAFGLVSRAPWLLAHALDQGARLIGTTMPGFVDPIAGEPLARRLDVIELPELDAAGAADVLRAVRDDLARHHRLAIPDAALEAVLQRSLTLAGRLPAKALALLDAAATRAALGGASEVDLCHVYLAGSDFREEVPS